MQAAAEIAGVVSDLEAAGLRPTAEQCAAFATYLRLIRDWGKRVNLVSPRDLDRLPRRHLLESFNVLLWPVPLSGLRLADIGSGAGFPALPLAVLQQDLRVVLVESVNRKAQFLAAVIKKLSLGPRVEVVCGRAEAIGNQEDRRAAFDVVTARGAGPLSRVVGWAAPFLKPGGLLVAYKGSAVEPELAQAMKPLIATGMSLVDVFPLRWGHGTLVILKKRDEPGTTAGGSTARGQGDGDRC